MKMKDFCSFIDEVMGEITDQELCECFWFYENEAAKLAAAKLETSEKGKNYVDHH
jgi:hypothetical protein